MPIRGSTITWLSPGASPRAVRMIVRADATSGAKIKTQSSERQAGTTPAVLSKPRVGLRPTMPFSAAGTRPEPAVSVPRAKATVPLATATAEPELEPPEIRPPPKTLSGTP